MKNLGWVVPVVIVVAFGIAVPAFAHHSHAMFDHSKPATVTGTVKEFVFRNPHVYLYLDVKNERGELITYWIEMSNITNMIKQGIPASSIVVIGKGESQPLVPTADGVREPQNRRVEIVI